MSYRVGDKVSIKAEIVSVDEECVRIYTEGYGERNFNLEYAPIEQKTYEQGLADAWELAKKVILATDDGGISLNDITEIFGSAYYAMRDFTYEEALAKIEAYEKEKEIKVGDVVEDEEGTKALVIDESTENTCFVFTENGCVENWYKVDLKKTGKKISIGDLLRQIGE